VRIGLGSGLAIALLVAAAPSLATTAEDLCGSPLPDPCVVTTTRSVAPGSILDFGAGALVLRTQSGRLDVGAGVLTILAREVSLETGAQLLGAGGSIAVVTAGDVRIADGARIDVSSAAGGGQVMVVAQNVTALGDVRADGSSTPALGGGVVVVTRDATVLRNVDASGGGQAYPPGAPTRGFVIAIAGTSLTVEGTIAVAHGDCSSCSIKLKAGGDVTLDRLDVHAVGPGGGGGSVDVNAGGSVTLNGDIAAQGSGGDPDTGGEGGEIEVAANQDVRLNQSIIARGTAPDGDGGLVEIDAGRDLIQANGSVIDTDGGGEGCGGSANAMEAGRDLRLATVQLSGDTCGAGALDVTAERDVTIAGPVLANASSDGIAGDVTVDAARTLSVEGPIRANGSPAGSGGTIDLEGCDLGVVAGAVLQTNGPDGENTLLAHGVMTLAGRLEAGSVNTLLYGDASRPPTITGVIVPPAVPQLSTLPPPCAQPVTCGNGVVDGVEECDDGNTLACDGCSATCKRETCGNRRLDCNEGCDPPDGVRCDATCQVVPIPVQRLPGPYRATGCQAEWEVEMTDGSVSERTGLPNRVQPCIDGDPGCDADGTRDGVCSVRTRICGRVQDPRQPLCTPEALEWVTVRVPDPRDPGDATDAANAAAIVGALTSMGVTVKAGSTVLHSGAPDTMADHCSPSFVLRVPHTGRTRRRSFSVGARDVAGRQLKSNTVKIDCVPNTAVCGDGAVGLGEACDDGNRQACDGCSPTCRVERCGNGVIDCTEECDAGADNGVPGGTCTAACTQPPPALRIPGGRSHSDCGLEFALALDPIRVTTDKRGLPKNRQTCVDGDPTCDFDPSIGRCRLHLFACVGGTDPRIGCEAAAVASVQVFKPSLFSAPTLYDALVVALANLGLPAPPGEHCSPRVSVSLPARSKTSIKLRATVPAGRPDSDTLTLTCLAAP
jgi:cysteine-rich repeat protein